MKSGPNRVRKLLSPQSVAVIGASNTKGKVGNIIFTALRYYDAKLYPVNPNESAIFGYKVYPTVSDIPGPVDVAIITVGAEQTIQIAEECAVKGVEIIIIVAGGFGEIGEAGKEYEDTYW